MGPMSGGEVIETREGVAEVYPCLKAVLMSNRAHNGGPSNRFGGLTNVALQTKAKVQNDRKACILNCRCRPFRVSTALWGCRLIIAEIQSDHAAALAGPDVHPASFVSRISEKPDRILRNALPCAQKRGRWEVLEPPSAKQ